MANKLRFTELVYRDPIRKTKILQFTACTGAEMGRYPETTGSSRGKRTGGRGRLRVRQRRKRCDHKAQRIILDNRRDANLFGDQAVL